MGNIGSIVNAILYLGYRPIISNDANQINKADSLLLPGVGSFRKAMVMLQKTGIDQAILEAVQVKKRKILGICLGMQLLGAYSFEDGYTPGLNLIAAPVERFPEQAGGQKVPHVGFNTAIIAQNSCLFKGLSDTADFYFVHSYRMISNELIGKMTVCHHGGPFLAAYEQDNLYATQFHPEKSQSNGLVLMKNFLDM